MTQKINKFSRFNSKAYLEDFFEKGFSIQKISKDDKLKELRSTVVEYIKEEFKLSSAESDEDYLNYFHKRKLGEPKINEIRLSLVNNLSTKEKLNLRIAELLNEYLVDLIGPDLLSQKRANFSIQSPFEENIIPVHSDSPANSEFEVVAWIPLTDVSETKSMFMANKEHSRIATNNFKNGLEGYKDYVEEALKHAEHYPVNFGEVLFFQTGNVHGCKINVEKETRWSINIRFKGLFHPFGMKNPFEFFDVISLSEFGKKAIEHKKSRLINV